MTALDTFYSIQERYPDEAGAERYFTERRWPSGVDCPKCGTVEVSRGTQAKRRPREGRAAQGLHRGPRYLRVLGLRSVEVLQADVGP